MRLLTRRNWIVALGILGLAFPIKAVLAQGGSATNIGAETCIACHSEKGEAFSKTLHGRKLPVVKDMSFEKSCETCHGAGSLHAEAAGDRDDSGFSTIKKFADLPKEKQSEICLSCHKQKSVMLWDVSSHAQSDLSCISCHSVHEGKGKKQLKLSETETCLECHKKNRMELSFPSHHPVLEGKMDCTSCHNPHGGEFGNLKAESAEELCFKCHAEKAGPFVHEHPPVVEDCSICHKPHGSANDNLLKQNQPFLCMTCHKWPHQKSTGAAWVGAINEYGRCTNCHRDIHGSDRGSRFTY